MRLRTILLAIASLIALPASATTYYISYSSGSNSNDGLAETTGGGHGPWQSHPYMQNAAGCAGSPPSYSHVAADIFIFKQGDIWPNACFDMAVAAGGTNGHPDQYTVDPTWGAAPGYLGNTGQPVGMYQFNAGGLVINGADGWNDFIFDNSINYIIFNGMELTGMYWTGCPSYGNAQMFQIQQSLGVIVSNAYAHNWTHSGATCDALEVMTGNNGTPFNLGSRLTGSVIDGLNSGGAGVSDSGMATLAIPLSDNNIIRNVSNGLLLGQNPTAYNNQIGPVNSSFDASIHENCIEPISMAAGVSNTVYIYGNVLHDCVAVNILTQGAPASNGWEYDYVFNNVMYLGAVATTPLQFDSVSTVNFRSQVHAWNNTFYAGAGLFCMRTVPRANGNFSVLDVQNNHCISGQGVIDLSSGVTGSPTYTNNNNVLMSLAAAAAQGYSSSQTFAYSPTLGSNGTVGAGANLSSLATGGTSSLADDTSYGGTRVFNARPPTGTWDAGAYQFTTPLSSTYYVDNCVTPGNDSNNGTSPSTAWLTVAQVNNSSFAPGSSILFQSTCLWRERLAPPSSGSSGNPITFGAYGAGAAPIINGTILLTGWTPGIPIVIPLQVTAQLDNAYDAAGFEYNNTTTLAIANADSYVRSGGMRFQNVTIAQGTALFSAVFQGKIYPGDTMNVSVYGEAADNAINFATGNPFPSARVKTSSTVPWVTGASGYQSVTVTPIVQEIINRAGWTSGHAMNILTKSQNSVPAHGRIFSYLAGGGEPLLTLTYLTTATNIYAQPFCCLQPFRALGPVFFDGIKVSLPAVSLAALTANNEWFFDSTAGYIYIYSTTNPSGRVIEIADGVRNYGLYVNGQSYLSFNNLSFQKGRNFSVEVAGASNIAFTNNEIAYAGSSGADTELGSSFISYLGGSSHDNGGLNGGDSDCFGLGGNGPGSSPISIIGVDIYGCLNAGIESFAPTASNGTVTMQYNHIHGNVHAGIQLDGPGKQTDLISGNLIVANSSTGILVNGSGAQTASIFNNTIAAGSAYCISALTGVTVFKNNLCMNNASEAFVANAASFTSDYNDFYHAAGGNFMSWKGTASGFSGWQTASSQDAHSLGTDPLVTNAGMGDYTLQSMSPLIHAGFNLGTLYENILFPSSTWPSGVATGNQNNYGGWNIGAYLYVAASPGGQATQIGGFAVGP